MKSGARGGNPSRPEVRGLGPSSERERANMNVDREAKDYTPEDVADVRQRMNEHREERGLSWPALAAAIGTGVGGGVAPSTLSAFSNATYSGVSENVAWKVNRYLQAEESRRNDALQMPDVPGYIATKTSRKMMAQMQFAHMGNIAVMVGAAGLGKTQTFERYRDITPNAFHLVLNRTTRTPGPMLTALSRVTGRQIKMRGFAMSNKFDDIVARLENLRAVLLIDEAQHATDATLDLLRQLHDATGAGLVLGGNRTVLGRVQAGVRDEEFAPLQSRISWPQTYDKPYPEDVELLCDAWGVKPGGQERAFLQKVGQQPGALRSVTQTLLMATIAARADHEDRTFSHITEAWTQQKRQPVAA